MVVLAVVALAPGARAAQASCPPSGARTLAVNGAAYLYTQSGSLYGCLGTRATRLGAAPAVRLPGAPRVALYALGPRYAGIALASMGVDTSSSVVAVVDLRSGRTVARAPATTPERRAESFISVTALLLDPHGTLAWIGARSAVGAFTPIFEVHTLTTAGANHLLASSAQIDPRSLTLAGETLHWRQANAPHSHRIG